MNVYNTHLCANCDATERQQQATVLLQFLATVESFFPEPKRTVLGGDFNTDLNVITDRPVYFAIVDPPQLFTDSYRAAQNNTCFSCCDAANPSEGIHGCTYAVPGNPFANNPPFATGPLSRIDYIFLRNSPGITFGVSASSVVFPPVTFLPPPAVPFVSDHSAVLTEIALQ